jgi:ferritin
VQLQPLGGPPADFTSPLQVFEEVKKHEQAVTKSIDQLYGMAHEAKDYASQVFLGWFITEQVEEERSSSHILESVRRVGDDQAALVMLDRELGQRGPEDAGAET